MIDVVEMRKENKQLRYELNDAYSANDRLSGQIWEDIKIIQNLHKQTRILLFSSILLVVTTASSLGYLYATIC